MKRALQGLHSYIPLGVQLEDLVTSQTMQHLCQEPKDAIYQGVEHGAGDDLLLYRTQRNGLSQNEAQVACGEVR